MDYSSKFFTNTNCEYFPCHVGIEEINCLFCYCPLYLKEDCPGNYKMIEAGGKQTKDCSDCLFPHRPENYSKVIEKTIV